MEIDQGLMIKAVRKIKSSNPDLDSIETFRFASDFITVPHHYDLPCRVIDVTSHRITKVVIPISYVNTTTKLLCVIEDKLKCYITLSDLSSLIQI